MRSLCKVIMRTRFFTMKYFTTTHSKNLCSCAEVLSIVHSLDLSYQSVFSLPRNLRDKRTTCASAGTCFFFTCTSTSTKAVKISGGIRKPSDEKAIWYKCPCAPIWQEHGKQHNRYLLTAKKSVRMCRFEFFGARQTHKTKDRVCTLICTPTVNSQVPFEHKTTPQTRQCVFVTGGHGTYARIATKSAENCPFSTLRMTKLWTPTNTWQVRHVLGLARTLVQPWETLLLFFFFTQTTGQVGIVRQKYQILLSKCSKLPREKIGFYANSRETFVQMAPLISHKLQRNDSYSCSGEVLVK